MACAMGMQGAAMRAIGVTVSTTYMTGALTILMDSIVTRRPFTTTDKSALGGLLSLVLALPPEATWLKCGCPWH